MERNGTDMGRRDIGRKALSEPIRIRGPVKNMWRGWEE
jgi:hypothetical protein